jgi:hypothetical protein
VNARFDLLVTGGEVLDPAAGLDGRLDLGLREGRIAAVAPDLPLDAATEVVEAAGLIAVPGCAWRPRRPIPTWSASRHGSTASRSAHSGSPRSMPYLALPPLVAPEGDDSCRD